MASHGSLVSTRVQPSCARSLGVSSPQTRFEPSAKPLFRHFPLRSTASRPAAALTEKLRASGIMEGSGFDSEGREFKSAEEMWTEEIGKEGDVHKRKEWYRQGVGYWEKGVEATTNGVLGGYAHVNDADIKGSEAFLKMLLAECFPGGGRDRDLVALDCGSGIGRVTKNLLIRFFSEKLRESLVPESGTAIENKATNFFCVPLQEFTPDVGRYDVIWIQWCIGHLADDDFVSFFMRAKQNIFQAGLKPGGLFILKENTARSGFVLDKEDRSITRSDTYFKELFHRCGLHIFKSKDQWGLPEELFAVKMYALTPDAPKRVHNTRAKAQANRPGIIK
ncbi:hypothetical protein BT93_L0998 [Corymbia citriodora subsp. variegata]|uniref:Alpha N-terminal protein methyltransferase 1 n=1 Tax=Corymbia citriodora subsp. variegata TaxID=360336 RepID=A0A8T0CSR1_CORYI|nr:hypothetical protein BT93_L0998 [Corymbia citriodora subsp. variegata]